MTGDNNIKRGMEHADDAEFDLQADNGEFFDEVYESEGMEEPTEDWEAYDSEFGSEEGAEAGESNKKKNSTFTLMLIGGAVLVGGFIFWTTFMNKPASVKQPAVQIASQKDTDSNTPPIPPLTETAQDSTNMQTAPKGGLLNDDKQLNGLAEHISSGVESARHDAPSDTGQQPPMPSPMASGQAQTAPSLPEDSNTLTPMPPATSPEGDMTEMQPVADTPAPPDMHAPSSQTSSAPAGASTPFMKADSQPAPAAAPQQPAAASANAALEAKLDTLLDRVSALETKLASMPSDNNIRSLIHSVDEIDGRLNKLEQSSPSAAPVTVAEGDHQGEREKTAPAVTAKAPARAAAVIGKPAKVQKSAARWVLKSAQPGLAYVSQAGREDMVTIRVGETLPGLGRISAINIVNGRWVVSGSEGSISQ